MLVMEEAKLPPPKPAVAARARTTPYEGRVVTAKIRPDTGISSRRALMVVQLRPPNRVTAKVYGSRITAPIRFGSATSQNFWSTEYGNWDAGRATTTTLHSVQTENPRCSAKIELTRLRRATRRPVAAQNDSSSGSQCVVHRPLRAGMSAAPAARWVIVVVMAADAMNHSLPLLCGRITGRVNDRAPGC